MAECRAQIDRIDAELLRLLNCRARLASEIGALKRSAGLPICDPSREVEVLRRLRQNNPGPLDEMSVARLFRSIMRESRRLQQRPLCAPANTISQSQRRSRHDRQHVRNSN
jgi:chorismate mutase-like protein